MARTRKITVDISTTANTKGLNAVVKALKDLQKTANALNGTSMKGLSEAFKKPDAGLVNMLNKVTDEAKEAQDTIKGLRRELSRLGNEGKTKDTKIDALNKQLDATLRKEEAAAKAGTTAHRRRMQQMRERSKLLQQEAAANSELRKQEQLHARVLNTAKQGQIAYNKRNLQAQKDAAAQQRAQLKRDTDFENTKNKAYATYSRRQSERERTQLSAASLILRARKQQADEEDRIYRRQERASVRREADLRREAAATTSAAERARKTAEADAMREERAALKKKEDIQRIINKMTADYEREAARQRKEAAKTESDATKAATAALKERERSEAAAMRSATAAAAQAARAQQAAMRAQNAAVQQVVRQYQNLQNIINRVASAIGSTMRAAFSGAANAARSFVSSAAAGFASLQRAIQAAGNGFKSFGNNVVQSMNRAKNAMMQTYATGFALQTVGRDLMQMGGRMFTSMSSSLDEYMEYERARVQTAISAASPQYGADGQITGYRIDNNIIDQLVMGLQRGTLAPEYLARGQQLPLAFSAKDIAQGLYYYTSAIGKTITEGNMDEVGGVVSTIMQMAQATNTSLESAVKGVTNIALQFGIDPRDDANAYEISNIAAQLGYLANISTLEVPDIIETFKYLGPQANQLSGGGAGQGMNEMFMMTFLASEAGLRGSKVGSGVSQAFSSLLDPTPKMIEMLGKYMPQVQDEQGFADTFFEPNSTILKGGITGFLSTIAREIPSGQQARFLAELFTQNATRNLGGIMPGFEKLISESGGLENWLVGIEDNPMLWLAEAAAETADSVTGWFTFMENGFFQFQRSIVDSVKGPLMGALRGIGEIFFQLGDAVADNPAIGQFFSAIATGIASIAAVSGGIFMVAGGVLLLSRVFAMAGGVIFPFIRIVAMSVAALGFVLPMLLAIAVAVGLLAAVWKSDFLGMASAFDEFKRNFTFEKDVMPAIAAVGRGLSTAGEAFQEFVGILTGDLSGGIDAIDRLLGSVFGPLVRDVMVSNLLELGDALGSVREGFDNTFNDKVLNVDTLVAAGRALQGFFEIVAIGYAQGQNLASMAIIGDFLGIDQMQSKMVSAATNVRSLVGQIITAFGMLRSSMASIGRQTLGNISEIFQGDIFGGITAGIQGFVAGLILAFTTAARATELITRGLAKVSTALRKTEADGRTFMGITISLSNGMKVLGLAMGALFGAKILLGFSPILQILTRLIPIITTVTAGIVGFGARILVVGANMAIMTAQILATAAAWAVEGAAKVASFVATTALSAAHALLASSTASVGLASIASGTGVMALVASFFMAQVSAASAAASYIAVGVATGGVAGIALAASASVSFLAAAFGIAAVGALAFAAIVAGIVAVLALIAGAMIAAVFATQGFGAGLAAIGEFAAGVWDGLQLGITVLAAVVAALASFGSAIGNAVSSGNEMRGMGEAIGTSISVITVALVAATAAVIAWGATSAAAWLISLGPIGAVIAAIVGIGIAMGLALQQMSEMGLKFDSTWDQMAVAAKAGGLKIADAFINGLIAGFNKMTSLSAGDSAFESFLVGAMPGLGLISKVGGDSLQMGNVDLAGEYLRGVQKDQQIAGVWDYQVPVNVKVEESGFQSSLFDALDNLGISDMANSLGINLEDLISGDMTLSEAWGVMEAKMGLSSLGYELDDITSSMESQNRLSKEQMDRMEQMRRKSESERKTPYDEFMSTTGTDIHASSSDLDMGLSSYTGAAVDAAESVAEAAYTLESATSDFRAAADALSSMTFEDYTKNLLDPLTGSAFGNSLGGFLAGQGGEDLLGAFSEEFGSWMNMTELWADVASSGVDLGADINGKNIHEMLRPGLELISQQTGVSMDDILSTIPKFYAPEEYFNVATMDMAEGIQGFAKQYGATMYEALDTIGQDTAGYAWSGGATMEQAGLDWAELNQYAIGQALAGQDWNLADYLSESWGISVQEAEAYLMDHGIDPTAFTNKTYDDLEEAVLSDNGRFSVMTQEWYDWLSTATNGFTTKVIQMTEDEWNKMSDAQKQIFTNMGYTFVVDDFISPESYAAAVDAVQSFADVLAGGEIVAAGSNGVMDGLMAQWSDVGTYIDEQTGEVMRVLQDLDGTQVSIPEVDYQAYLSSLEVIKKATEDVRNFLAQAGEYANTSGTFELGGKQTPKAPFDYSSSLDMLNNAANAQRDVMAGKATFIAQNQVKVSDIIPATLQSDITAAVAPAISQGVADGISQANLGSLGTEITSQFTSAMSGVSAAISSSMNFQGFATQAGAAGAAAGQAFQNAFRMAMSTAITPVSSNMGGDYMNAGGSGGSGIKIDIDTSAALRKIEDVKQKIATLGGTDASNKIFTIEANTDAANAALTSLQQKLSYFATGSWPINITLTDGGAVQKVEELRMKLSAIAMGSYTVNIVVNIDEGVNWQTLSDSLANIASSTWVVNISVEIDSAGLDDLNLKLDTIGNGSWNAKVSASTGMATGAIELVLQKLRYLTAGSWVAKVGANVGAAASAIESILAKLRYLTAGAWNASVGVNDNASGALNNILGLLGSIDGYTATATASVTTTNTTINRVIGANTSTAATGGWRSGGQSVLVGEEGPEVVYFPSSGYVYTAPETNEIAAMMSTASISSNSPNITPSASGGNGPSGSGGSSIVYRSGDYNHHGDVILNDVKAVDQYFDRIDRMTGKRQENARRGMYPTDMKN